MSEPSIRFDGVGKMYKVFASRRANLLDALGLERFSRAGGSYREFWALRGVDLELHPGQRLGVIGRNGAGKSTLLKLVTGNLAPTEGTVEVRGDVQALLEIGGGLHPEFTGRENIDAALAFMGLSRSEIAAATTDIAEFTELGRFLDQPFKTYSQGMQARLSIGIATTLEPEILIVDEILGAGDAYFFAKSTARMQRLIDSGATVLLVSHALDQVARFCDESIWLDRGRIVMRGETNEVVKAYERFIRELDDQRLRARNRKSRIGVDAFEREGYMDSLLLTLQPGGSSGCAVAEVVLLRDDAPEERLAVGDPQDAEPSLQSSIVLDGGFGPPVGEGEDSFHRVVPSGAAGSAIFHLWFLYPGSQYAFEVRYRADAPVHATVRRGDELVCETMLRPSDGWVTTTLDLAIGAPSAEAALVTTKSRWSGAGDLLIDDVRLLGADGAEQAVFEVGGPFTVDIEVVAQRTGTFPLIPAALSFTPNGQVVTRHIGEASTLTLEDGEQVTARLTLPELLLGNGTYLLSVGLYRTLDVHLVEESEFYDYFDKSFEYRVVGNPPLHTELVRHPGGWTIERAQAPAPAVAPRAVP